MAGLIGNLLGTRNVSKQSGSQNQSTHRQQNPRQRQLQDILTRILTSQAVSPPNTAISVPFQQAVSEAQANMPRLNAQAAHGLASGEAQAAANNPLSSGAPMLPGAGQAGLQTRAQLGLPDRASYLGPLAPSLEEVRKAGIADIRGGTAAEQKANAKAKRQAAKQAGGPPAPDFMRKRQQG